VSRTVAKEKRALAVAADLRTAPHGVVGAKSQAELSPRLNGLAEAKDELGIVVTNGGVLAADHLPGLVTVDTLGRHDLEVGQERRYAAELQAKPGREQHLSIPVRDGPHGATAEHIPVLPVVV
jgi:hypothetical protein